MKKEITFHIDRPTPKKCKRYRDAAHVLFETVGMKAYGRFKTTSGWISPGDGELVTLKGSDVIRLNQHSITVKYGKQTLQITRTNQAPQYIAMRCITS